MLPGLKSARISKGLSQEELSEESGVHRDTIHKLETGQRPARPATIKKLADTLGVETEELTKDPKEETMEETRTAGKVEVEVRWEDRDGRFGGEILRFRGEEIDIYEYQRATATLYECPGGYRVYVENYGDAIAELHPAVPSATGELEYPTYSVEELVEEFPVFGATVGVYRVRDID
jgi:transcriptional regulator with XRE-family HTH domain